MYHFFIKYLGLITFCGLLITAPIAEARPGDTLSHLIQQAIKNNKDLQAAKYNVNLAKTRLVQAGQWLNPSLELSDIDDHTFSNEGEYTRSVGFSQEFPVAGRIGRQKDVARVDVAIAQTEIEDAERKLAGEVATNYYSLFIIKQRLNLINRLIPVNKRLMQAARQRFKAAEVSELDANTAQLEYQRLLQEKHVLESQQLSQQANLNALLGQSPQTPLVLNYSLPSIRSLPSMTQLQKFALQNRPDLAAAWLSIHRAQADKALAHAQRWADWRIGVGVEQSRQVIEGAPPQNPNRALMLNLSVPIPLLNQNQGRIAEAAVAYTQASVKLRALKLNTETEIASNYTQLQSLKAVIQQSQKSSLTLSAKNVRLAQLAYSAGQISLFDVVQAQRQQSELQTTYLNTLDLYLQAFVKLQIATGRNFSLIVTREVNQSC